ncbi:MAG TPA: serine/threonine-protein kinase [Gemmatimonadaceae bacterium]|nr:serine/threonine-protein kinase [Gemmatimonadaceae bacterium]
MTDIRDQLQQCLAATYSIERELGGGGMSRVFVATERALGRTVVVKVLSQELAGGLSAERFRREIQVAASLQHPGIVPLLTAGDAGGLPFYTMPFVEGESLRSRLRGGELSVRAALSILRDVARALEYAHAHGVIHRDIKPDNVLLSADYAMVTDFGVAKALLAARSDTHDATLTQLGVAIGTPAYMSPEQGAGEAVDHRADIYAFGCTAYEMLTGAAPFTAPSAQAVIAAHATRTPQPITSVRPSVPGPAAQLVMQCLEKRPADRPQSARDLIVAIDAAITPGTGTAQPRVPHKTRRTWIAVGALGVVGAAVVVALGLRRDATPVRENAVVVTPFRVAGADASLRPLREGMLDLISAKLTGNVHAVDTRTVLSGWRKRGGGETTDLTRVQSLALASSVGAGRLLEGDIVGMPQRLVISASLVSVPSGQVRATAHATGEQQQLALLVDSLTAELLVQEAGADEMQSRDLAGIPFEALQAYLAGQAAYRRGRYQEAEGAYSHALDIDSTFALAAIQLRLAASWTSSGRGARGLVLALREYPKLGTRERIMLDGEDTSYLSGRRRSCSEIRAGAERATLQSPDIPEVWTSLAEQYFHCGWVIASGYDPWRRAAAAFERALALDSGFAPAREHLPIIYAALGDTAKALRAIAAQRTDSTDMADFNLFIIGLLPDSAQRWQRFERMMSRNLSLTDMMPMAPLFGGNYVDDADRMLATLQRAAVTDAQRRRLATVERSLALNFGQPRRAMLAIRSIRQVTPFTLLAAAFWDGDTTDAPSTLAYALQAFDHPPIPDSIDVWTDWLFSAAQYGLMRGDDALARRAIVQLRGFRPPPGQPWRATRPQQLALLLDAQVAAREKRGDASLLRARADSLVALGPSGSWVMSAGALIVTRLWEQTGDLDRAHAAIKRLYYSANIYGPNFWSTYHLERARIADAVGSRDEAMAEYRLYLALRQHPEPGLQPQARVAREALARLERAAR